MYILLGLPGSGKSVQANLFKERQGIYHIAPGILLRKKSQEPQYEYLKNLLKTGQLINDEIVANIIQEEIQKNQDGIFIIEGYPRTIEQLTTFNGILKNDKNQYLIKKVIVLDCNDNVIKNRLNTRKICQQCHKSFQNYSINCHECNIPLTFREDDHPEAIDKRIISQKNYLNKILNYFTQEGIEVIKISGEESIEEIYNSINKIFLQYKI
jgi:adenylate kinase